jgi:hypothetical protein
MQPIVEIAAGWYKLELLFPPEGVIDLIVKISLGKADQYWFRPPALDRNHFAANLRVADPVTEITLFVGGSGEVRRPIRFSFGRANHAVWLLSLVGRALRRLRREPLRFVHSAAFGLWGLTRPGSLATSRGSAARRGEEPYDTWIRLFDENPTDHRHRSH